MPGNMASCTCSIETIGTPYPLRVSHPTSTTAAPVQRNILGGLFDGAISHRHSAYEGDSFGSICAV
jgi:hypothetical protein